MSPACPLSPNHFAPAGLESKYGNFIHTERRGNSLAFHIMSNQTFWEKCEAIFNRANGGKPLTVGSLAAVIREACPSYQGSDQDIAQIFLEIDENQDRLISLEEFRKSMTAKSPKEIERATLEDEFKLLDKDGSGTLNRIEIKRLCVEVGLKLSEKCLDELINAADHNKDGVISYDEFLQAWYNSS
ncbi:hypothetical protein BsWGS_05202 [Bradybaena similaris]